MSEQLLTILKICLLVLLYLFFFRVLRAVWVEVNGPKRPERRPTPVPAGVAVGPSAGPADGRDSRQKQKRSKRSAATQLVVVEPPELAGRSYPVGDELTVGRAPGCGIALEDTFASQIHARIFARDGQLFAEDLGSTNGTAVNRKKVTGPTAMRRGDKLQVGNTVLELR